MITHKCDICKKQIKENDKSMRVTSGFRLSGPEFHEKCAEPIIKFLEKHKLILNKKY